MKEIESQTWDGLMSQMRERAADPEAVSLREAVNADPELANLVSQALAGGATLIGLPQHYQATHSPIRKQETLCTSREPLTSEGMCPACGRSLKRGGRDHKPNEPGVR